MLLNPTVYHFTKYGLVAEVISSTRLYVQQSCIRFLSELLYGLRRLQQLALEILSLVSPQSADAGEGLLAVLALRRQGKTSNVSYCKLLNKRKVQRESGQIIV
ncbi:MAG: hypothetical protein ACKPKO_12950, partial [Candidatus Fonsibacter sp.]